MAHAARYNRFLWIGGLMAALGFLGVLAMIGPLKLKQLSTASWPSARAVLLDLELQQKNDNGQDLYGIKAVYTFSYNGMQIQNSGVTINDPMFIADKAYITSLYQRLEPALKGEETIDIKYNPANLKQSIIIDDVRMGSRHTGILLWVIVMLSGGIIAGFGYYQKRSA